MKYNTEENREKLAVEDHNDLHKISKDAAPSVVSSRES